MALNQDYFGSSYFAKRFLEMTISWTKFDEKKKGTVFRCLTGK